MTATAANVAFAWSHDIGGFAGAPESEIMLRWVAFGVFSPVLRPHCAGRGGNTRDIWRFDWPAFEALRDLFRLRARLVPYLAGASREAYETGVQVVYPLYYDWPHAPAAYEHHALHQFACGRAIWVSPVTAPAAAGRTLADSHVWFPPGAWVEWGSWQLHVSPAPAGATYARRFASDEMPAYSPAGAILPLRTLPGVDGPAAGAGDVVGTAVDVPAALTLYVMPPPLKSSAGTGNDAGTVYFSSEARVYDDDGVSMAYVGGAFRWTNVTCAWARGRAGAGDTLALTIAPGGGGGFPEMPLRRAWTLRLVGAWPPASVSVGGARAAPVPSAVPGRWGEGARWPAAGAVPAFAYDGATASAWVHAPPANADEPLTIAVEWPRGTAADDPLLTSALARKVARAQATKGAVNLAAWAVVPADVPAVLAAAGAPARVEAAFAAGHEAAAAAEAAGESDVADAALEVMAARVRGLYAGLVGNITAGLAEVAALDARGGVDAAHLALMREMLGNALE